MWPGAFEFLQSRFADFLAAATYWAMAAAVLVGTSIAVLVLHRTVVGFLGRILSERRPFLRTIISATEGPTRLAFLLIGLSAALPLTPLSADTQATLARLVALATICLLGWAAAAALGIAAELYLLRFRLDVDDNLLARKHITQVRVLVRVLDVVIMLVTVGFALMTFDAVRQYGVTLFASAGVAGIAAGLAARPILSNFLAGVQLAMAQPIRIDDAVIVENEWGNIEEITFTYVVVRLWDWRRMIVPLSYFMEKPFQNWTRTGGELIGSVFLYVDHTVPIEAVRAKLKHIAAQSKLWDGRVVNLQVSDCKEATVELRVLVSARNAPAVWDLRCEVREKLIDFLQREHPWALPRRRYDAEGAAMPAARDARRVRSTWRNKNEARL